MTTELPRNKEDNARIQLRKYGSVDADEPFPVCQCKQLAALLVILYFLPKDKARFTHRRVCQQLHWWLQKKREGTGKIRVGVRDFSLFPLKCIKLINKERKWIAK